MLVIPEACVYCVSRFKSTVSGLKIISSHGSNSTKPKAVHFDSNKLAMDWRSLINRELGLQSKVKLSASVKNQPGCDLDRGKRFCNAFVLNV